MSKQLQRVLVAVPAAKQIEAGKEYTKHSKNPADDNSFTAGFVDDKQQEWAIACWAIDKTTIAQFDALIAAYPEARVAKWLDDQSTAEEQLASLKLSRPPIELPTKAETKGLFASIFGGK